MHVNYVQPVLPLPLPLTLTLGRLRPVKGLGGLGERGKAPFPQGSPTVFLKLAPMKFHGIDIF